MRIRETNLDERLDLLENIEDGKGEVFLCEKKTNRNAFHNKTVAKLTENKEATHAMLIFEDGIPRHKAERTAKRIGRTIEAFNRAIDVDIFFEVPGELFDLIRKECRTKRKGKSPNTRKYMKTQEDALRDLRTSTKQGFGIFSTNATEDVSKPLDRIYLLMRIPALNWLPRLTFRTPEMAAALIEDLIAHRRHVWPDADPIDPDAELED